MRREHDSPEPLIVASLALDGVDKIFANGQVAARALDLRVEDGELAVLVGPSGCGKSTALRLIAGLEPPTRGRIRIDDYDVTDLPPRERDLAMVFQSYALYPHMSVRRNLEYGLRVRGMPRTERARRVEAVAVTLGIAELLDRRPSQLSGGQRQRVALGRALVREPKAFLLDEPLSNLDPELRVRTRTELSLLHRRLGATILHVTHDQEEAMTLGDRIAVMRDGRIEQFAAPLELYRRPANVFVAGFIGSPTMNLLPARIVAEAKQNVVRFDSDALLGIRPHDAALARPDALPGPPMIRLGAGVVELVEPLGPTQIVHARIDAGGGSTIDVRVIAAADAPVAVGDRVAIDARADRCLAFDARDGRRL